MLTRVYRLALNRDFRLVFKTGHNFDADLFRIKIAKNKKNVSRFGFVVSAKVARRAHDRNKIKRRMRSAVRFLLPNLKPGFDVVIWPKSHIKNSRYQDIAVSLQNLFKKSSLWQRKIIIILIRFYQILISPAVHWLSFSFFGTSAGCRFELSCSQYAIKAFSANGLFAASRLVLKRLGRCHAFN